MSAYRRVVARLRLGIMTGNMIDESRLTALISAIYDAAVDFDRWPDVLCAISTVCASHTTVLTRQGDSPGESWNLAPQCDRAYHESYGLYYHSVNPLWQRAASAPAGSVLTDTMMMSKNELVRTEFYNDFLAPQRLGSMLSTVTAVEDGRQTIIAAHRQPEFESGHVRLFQLLAPHLQRAVQLNVKLAKLELRHEASAEVLNRLERGVLLVDGSAGLVFANREAERLFAGGGGLRLTDGILCTGSEADATLHALIAGCARGGAETGAGGSLTLSRGPGRAPLSLLVAPLRSDANPFAMRRPVAILFISDPDRAVLSPAAWIRQQFGLTAAEAAFATEIIAGAGIQAAADRLQISRSTGRTHLARIFEKTGTHRQAELVRLMLQYNHAANGET